MTPTSTAAMWNPTASLMPTPPCFPIIVLWENKLPQLQKGLNVTNRLRLPLILKELAPLCIPFSRTQMEPYFSMRVVKGWRDRSSWSNACMAPLIPRIHIKKLGKATSGSRDRRLSSLVSHPDLYTVISRFTERSCVSIQCGIDTLRMSSGRHTGIHTRMNLEATIQKSFSQHLHPTWRYKVLPVQ